MLDEHTHAGYAGGMKPPIKRRATHRLKIIAGQLTGLARMVESEEYCIDILRQSTAIREALSSVENLLLENHLSTCVVEQMRSGKAAKATSEILEVYKVAKGK